MAEAEKDLQLHKSLRVLLKVTTEFQTRGTVTGTGVDRSHG